MHIMGHRHLFRLYVSARVKRSPPKRTGQTRESPAVWRGFRITSLGDSPWSTSDPFPLLCFSLSRSMPAHSFAYDFLGGAAFWALSLTELTVFSTLSP